VVGTYEHDIGAVSVVAAVPYEGVAISSGGRVRRDLHPGTGVVVVPALIVIGAHLVATGVDAADESFLTGTAAEITPIREVDGRKIGEGKPGPLTRKLQDVYYAAIHGKVEKYLDWLNFVK
jgi:hypothetical protein